MCVLTKCCCCVDLRTGAMVMAILQVLGVLGSFGSRGMDGGLAMFVSGGLALVAGLCLLYGAIKYEPTATLVYLVFQMLSIITVTIAAIFLVFVATVATDAVHHADNVHKPYGVNINNPYGGVNVHNPDGVNINNPYGGYNVHNPYGGLKSSNDAPDVATATTIAVDIMAIALACYVLISIYFWVCAFSFYKGLKSGSITPSAEFRKLAEYF